MLQYHAPAFLTRFKKDYRTFQALGLSPLKWWWFALVFLSACLFYLINASEVLVMAFVIMFLLITHFNFIGYIFFRGWDKKLPFELIGWSSLVSQKGFTNIYRWTNIEISIICKDSPHSKIQLLQNELNKFIVKANAQFYSMEFTADMKEDPRKLWTMEHLTLRGSLNNQVARELYKFLTKNLNKTGIQLIEKIIIKETRNPKEIAINAFFPP